MSNSTKFQAYILEHGGNCHHAKTFHGSRAHVLKKNEKKSFCACKKGKNEKKVPAKKNECPRAKKKKKKKEHVKRKNRQENFSKKRTVSAYFNKFKTGEKENSPTCQFFKNYGPVPTCSKKFKKE
jgi:hypothetical protein